jgi:hypothetical protein
VRLGRASLIASLLVSTAAALRIQAQELRFIPSATARFDQVSHVSGVQDAVADGLGHIVLLDGRNARVVVTDESLRPLSSLGSRGTTSSQFIEPVALSRIAAGRIAVLDRSLRRITELRIAASGRSVVANSNVPLDVRSTAFCALGPKQFMIYAPRNRFRLHVLSQSDRTVRSFAPIDAHWSTIASTVVFQGKLACDLPRDLAVISSDYRPYVEGYRISSGKLVWIDTLRGTRAPRIVDRDTSVTVSGGSAGYSMITGVLDSPGLRVYQTVFDGRTDGATIDTITTYSYQTGRNEWLPAMVSLPRLLALDGERAITVDPARRQIQIGRIAIVGGPSAKPRRGGSIK